MKDKLLTLSLFMTAALMIAGIFLAAYENAFTKVQGEVVKNIKKIEQY